MGWSGGWPNWRLRSGRRHTDRYPYLARAGCATAAGGRRTRLAPPGMAPALS
jgi:hypothetical protein